LAALDSPPNPARQIHRSASIMGRCVRVRFRNALAGWRDPGRWPIERGAREMSSATVHPLSIASRHSTMLVSARLRVSDLMDSPAVLVLSLSKIQVQSLA